MQQAPHPALHPTIVALSPCFIIRILIFNPGTFLFEH
jgi:hypothetical protein